MSPALIVAGLTVYGLRSTVHGPGDVRRRRSHRGATATAGQWRLAPSAAASYRRGRRRLQAALGRLTSDYTRRPLLQSPPRL